MNCNAHTCLCTYMLTWGTFPSMHLATDVDCLLILASHGNHCLHLRLQVPKSILACVDRIFYSMLSICLWVVQHPKSSVNTYTTLGSSHWLSDKKNQRMAYIPIRDHGFLIYFVPLHSSKYLCSLEWLPSLPSGTLSSARL